MRMRGATLAAVIVLSLAGCERETEPDAYGNIEAIDVLVGAEASGKIEAFTPKEGDRIISGAIVGRIETTGTDLEQQQLEAQRDATASRLDELAQQIDGFSVQRTIAGRAYERTRRLHAQRAATAQQLDANEREYRVLGEQLDAARAQSETLRREITAAEARVAQAAERSGKGAITNPIDGTVLTTYVSAGEFARMGQPLYRIADLRTMEVRAYITGAQLATTSVGQRARISVDAGEDERASLDGTVTWISSDAEFTPTPIQTREDRGDLVYAVRIRVANPEGILKIGMPVDVQLSPTPAGR